MHTANTEAAKKFVGFSMRDAYLQTLSVALEGKHPVRHGDATDPKRGSEGNTERY